MKRRRAIGRVGRIDQRLRRAGDGEKRDRHRVIRDPAPVGVARYVSTDQCPRLRIRRRRNGHVQPKDIRVRCSGEVLEARHHARRDSGQQDRDEIRAILGDRQGWGRRPGTARAAAGKLRLIHVLRELGVGTGWFDVPSVLLPERDDDLVEQRVAEPRDLHPWPASLAVAAWRRWPSRTGGAMSCRLQRLAEPQMPSTDFELVASVGSSRPSSAVDRDLDRDRMDVERAPAGRR